MIEKVLKDLDCNKTELSILLTDNEHIAYLNNRYLGRDGPTNVLAFPMSDDLSPDVESGMLGDVVVSVDTAISESEETGESQEEAIFRLLIHGILHLMGYDHMISSDEAQVMEKEERRLLSLVLRPPLH
ncbi:MAG: rRNA maturation RNase YbeY [Deltaproteobacteria bacterium]|nr:rRNA maturation RNase YbeY [Deltaproteobacteria bacterium]